MSKFLSCSLILITFTSLTRYIWGGSVATYKMVLLEFSHTVKAATLIFISGCGSAISSAKEGKSGFIYNLVKS